MTRHLSSAGGRISRCADGLVQHFCGCDAELEEKRAIAVVRVEPVVGGLQYHSRGGEYSLVAGAGNLKEDLVLSLELDLFVIELAGQKHCAISANELIRPERTIGSS